MLPGSRLGLAPVCVFNKRLDLDPVLRGDPATVGFVIGDPGSGSTDRLGKLALGEIEGFSGILNFHRDVYRFHSGGYHTQYFVRCQ